MDKKMVRKCHKLDMVHFLRNYCGITNERLIFDLSNLSHRELKVLAPDYGLKLVRTGFDLVSLDQIADGTIILVNDCYNAPAPYVNPARLMSWDREFDTILDISYISVTEEVTFDEKGRQKTLKRKVKLRRGGKDGKH